MNFREFLKESKVTYWGSYDVAGKKGDFEITVANMEDENLVKKELKKKYGITVGEILDNDGETWELKNGEINFSGSEM